METEIRIYDAGDGRFCLTLMDADERTSALFEARDLQGGGYTWEGIISILVEMRMPTAGPQLQFGAEADNINMYVYCSERKVLDDLEAVIREAIADHRLLVAAIERGGDQIE